MDYQIKMLKIANSLDKKGYYELADNFTKYAGEIEEIANTINSAKPQVLNLEVNINDPESPRIYFIADPHFMDDKKTNNMQWLTAKNPNIKLYDEEKYFNTLYPNEEIQKRRSDDYNRYLIAKWNQMIRPQDIVFVVGDFAAAGPQLKHVLKNIIKMLHGNIIFIEGNHEYHGIDKKSGINRREREQVSKHIRESYGLNEPRDSYLQIPHAIIEQLGNNPILPSAIVNISQQGQDPVSLFLSHFEQEDLEKWHGAQNHGYAHTHGMKEDDPQKRSIDLGVDIHDGPINFDQLQNIMKSKDNTKKRNNINEIGDYAQKKTRENMRNIKKRINKKTIQQLQEKNLPNNIYRMELSKIINEEANKQNLPQQNIPVFWPTEVYEN